MSRSPWPDLLSFSCRFIGIDRPQWDAAGGRELDGQLILDHVEPPIDRVDWTAKFRLRLTRRIDQAVSLTATVQTVAEPLSPLPQRSFRFLCYCVHLFVLNVEPRFSHGEPPSTCATSG